MPRMFLLVCDDDERASLTNILQMFRNAGLPAAAVEYQATSTEWKLPHVEVARQILQPMFVRLRQIYR